MDFVTGHLLSEVDSAANKVVMVELPPRQQQEEEEEATALGTIGRGVVTAKSACGRCVGPVENPCDETTDVPKNKASNKTVDG
jgi:hypothetical protein